MSENEVKRIIYILAPLTILLWGGYIFISGAEIFSVASGKAVLSTTAAVTVITGFYLNIAWKLPLLNKVFFRTNLNGTWLGEFQSDYINEDGIRIPPKKFVIVIRQNLLKLSIRAYSEKLTTSTHVEDFSVDKRSGLKRLAYIYSEKRATSGNHGVRLGAADLELHEGLDDRILSGDYWTFDNTTGFVYVKLVNQKVFAESFKDSVNRWPDVTIWATIPRSQLNEHS